LIVLSIQTMVRVVIYLIITGLVFWLLWWLVNYIAPPEPFRKVANIVLAIFAVLVVIGILLSLVAGQPIFAP
jgi:hypothetical protein